MKKIIIIIILFVSTTTIFPIENELNITRINEAIDLLVDSIKFNREGKSIKSSSSKESGIKILKELFSAGKVYTNPKDCGFQRIDYLDTFILPCINEKAHSSYPEEIPYHIEFKFITKKSNGVMFGTLPKNITNDNIVEKFEELEMHNISTGTFSGGTLKSEQFNAKIKIISSTYSYFYTSYKTFNMYYGSGFTIIVLCKIEDISF